jgi:hypothetical protein
MVSVKSGLHLCFWIDLGRGDREQEIVEEFKAACAGSTKQKEEIQGKRTLL